MSNPLASTAAGNNDLQNLVCLSARLGANRLLVQASTGNTSLKTGNTMWVKASGKWLAHAEDQEIFTPVNLDDVRLRLISGQPLRSDTDLHGMRPSVETFMHAVLPHRVVVHVHGVHSICAGIRADAIDLLTCRLRGIDWALIPHAESGQPLALAIASAIAADSSTRVFVLANHGLVVCGDTCEETERLLLAVERALHVDPRPVPMHRVDLLRQIQRLSKWSLPADDVIHRLATDPFMRRITKAGVLYPCQALFLGHPLPFVPCSETLAGPHMSPRNSPFLILEGCGVLVSHQITAAEYATLYGFAEVVGRIDPGTRLRYLQSAEIEQLLHAESAQAYKRSPANLLYQREVFTGRTA